jgi:hypothetical protein
MWSRSDILGLFSINVGSFSLNLVPSVSLFSINLVRELARLSGRALYVERSRYAESLIDERER